MVEKDEVELMDYAKEIKFLERIGDRIEVSNHWLCEILKVLKEIRNDGFKVTIPEDQQKVSKESQTEEIKKSEPNILEEVDSKSDLTLINIGIKVETDKAILVIDNTTKKVAWIPKKAITMNKPLTIANWFKDKLKWEEDKSW